MFQTPNSERFSSFLENMSKEKSSFHPERNCSQPGTTSSSEIETRRSSGKWLLLSFPEHSGPRPLGFVRQPGRHNKEDMIFPPQDEFKRKRSTGRDSEEREALISASKAITALAVTAAEKLKEPVQTANRSRRSNSDVAAQEDEDDKENKSGYTKELLKYLKLFQKKCIALL